MEKGYRFRIYPTPDQEELIHKTFGCTRFVYNHYLDKRKTLYRDFKEIFGYKKCSDDLKNLKQEYGWLREVDSIALQASCEHLQNAYDQYFKARKRADNKWGLPVFKSKKDNEKSYTTKKTNGIDYPNSKHLKKSLKKLAKAGRQHSRKQIGSKSREKARVKLARIHEDVANQRLDSIHKMTTDIVRNYDIRGSNSEAPKTGI